MARSGIKYGNKIELEQAIEHNRFILWIDGGIALRGDRKTVMGEFDRVLRSGRKVGKIKVEYKGKFK